MRVSLIDLVVLYKRELSAKSLRVVLTESLLEMSLIYIRKKRGLRTVPWGTSEQTLVGEDTILFTTTL